MKKILNRKNISLFLVSLLLCLTLASCVDISTPDWEDELPTAESTVTTTVETEVVETTQPITVIVPEITETTTRKTEIATTTTPRATTTVTEITTLADTTTVTAETTHDVSDIPSVPAADLTETTTEAVTTTQEPVVIQEAIFNPFDNYFGNPEEPYVYNDPIVRPYAYYELSDVDKKRYDFLVDKIEKHVEEQIKVPDEVEMSVDDFKRLYQLIYDIEHRFFHVGLNMNYMINQRNDTVAYITFSYEYSNSEYVEMTNKVNEEAKKILAKITSDMTEYDIVKLFYDEIAMNCIYDINAPNLRDVYGALVEKRAVCGGFAKAFSYLCDKVGINSLTISGDDGDVPHMWNMVQIGGDWYHIDPTNSVVEFDDGTFGLRYDYFNVTDEVIKKDTVIYPTAYDYPVANATKYNYFYYNGLIVSSFDDAVNLVKSELASASINGKKVVSISALNQAVYNEMCDNFFSYSTYNILDIIEEVNVGLVNKINTDSINYNYYDDTYCFVFFLNYN